MNFYDWVEAVRLKFLPQGVLPVLLGSAVAIHNNHAFNALYFILAFFGMALVQFALTMLNDLIDFLQGTDTRTSGEKNPYSGGSGVLRDGRIKPRDMLAVIALFYLAALAIGIYLTSKLGITLLYIVLAGFFISIFYTLKPLQFAYRGLGEIAMFLGYGPTITLGAYFVQAAQLSWQGFLAGFVPGALMFAMIVVNEIPDYEEDSRANKRNITVRFGVENARKIYAASLAVIYLFIFFAALLGVFPLATHLTLLSLPFAYRSVKYTNLYYRDRILMAKANREMVRVYSSAMLLFTLGFLVKLR